MMNEMNYQSCSDACLRCAQECEHCAEACRAEEDAAQFSGCMELDRDCAEICFLAAALMSRGSRFAGEFCQLCANVCDACGAECRHHDVDHCQRCADACEACADECRRMAGVAV